MHSWEPILEPTPKRLETEPQQSDEKNEPVEIHPTGSQQEIGQKTQEKQRPTRKTTATQLGPVKKAQDGNEADNAMIKMSNKSAKSSFALKRPLVGRRAGANPQRGAKLSSRGTESRQDFSHKSSK